MKFMDTLNALLRGQPAVRPDQTEPASPWLVQPSAMAAKAIELRAIEAMAANRRARDLMPLCADWKPDCVPARAVVEVKHDGIHVGYYGAMAGYPLFTREGVDFPAAAHLLDDLAAVDAQLGGDHVLFGEYVNFGGFEAALADQARGKGSGTIVLFDAVPRRVWEGREPGVSQLERSGALQVAVSSLGDRGVCVVKAALFTGGNVDRIEEAAGGVWEMGMEGIVVKDADALFARGRSGHWQRIKRKLTADLRIIGTKVENGRLSSLTLDLPSGKPLKVGVGFSEAMRRAPDRFQPGMIAEIAHLGETKGGALRSASFKRLRGDRA